MNLQETKNEVKNILKNIDGVVNKLPIVQKGQVILQKKVLENILLLSSNSKTDEFKLDEDEIEMIMDFKKLILASQDFEVINKEKERNEYVESIKEWRSEHDKEYIKLTDELIDLFQESYLKFNAVAA